MIIVSQDKSKISNFDNITQIYITNSEDNEWYIRYESVDSLYEDLGEYKTEERAKEVLKEIWNFYEIAKRHESSGNDGMTIYLENRFVYQMSED